MAVGSCRRRRSRWDPEHAVDDDPEAVNREITYEGGDVAVAELDLSCCLVRGRTEGPHPAGDDHRPEVVRCDPGGAPASRRLTVGFPAPGMPVLIRVLATAPPSITRGTRRGGL